MSSSTTLNALVMNTVTGEKGPFLVTTTAEKLIPEKDERLLLYLDVKLL